MFIVKSIDDGDYKLVRGVEGTFKMAKRPTYIAPAPADIATFETSIEAYVASQHIFGLLEVVELPLHWR